MRILRIFENINHMITEIPTWWFKPCLPRGSDEFSQHRGVYQASAAQARVMIHRLKYFKSYLNIFDALLVVAGSEIAVFYGASKCVAESSRALTERSPSLAQEGEPGLEVRPIFLASKSPLQRVFEWNQQVVGLIDMIILEEVIDGGGGVNLVVLRFLRIIKLARTLRALRVLTACQDLQRLLEAIWNMSHVMSCNTLNYIEL